MDSEQQTSEQQLLEQAKRQTLTLESLRAIALFWSIATALAGIVWLVTAMRAG